MYGLKKWLLAMLIACLAISAHAEDVSREQIKSLDEQVQDIKKDVIDLTAELSLLEEKLLYPSNTQVSVFVSTPEGDEFRLDAVQIKLNNKVVAHHLYTFRELEALHRGGVQRIYTGNVKTGDHSMVVSFVGKGSAGGELHRSASYTLNKGVGPKFVQVVISGPDTGADDIQFKDW